MTTDTYFCLVDFVKVKDKKAIKSEGMVNVYFIACKISQMEKK
jgi:hypothetical protein